MSDLARHTQNIRNHERVSLMVLESGGKPVYEKKRVAVQGIAHEIKEKEKVEAFRKEYLRRYPQAQIFFTLPDFHFFEIEISELYFVGGFGKIESLKP